MWWHRLPPLVLYGRYSRRDPPCQNQECVYYFWRDRRCYEVTSNQQQCFLYLTLRIGFEQLFLFHLLQQTFEAPVFFSLCV